MKTFLLSLFIVFITGVATAQAVYSDVAGIFYSRCTGCHHENQHPPSLMTYSKVNALSATIDAYLTSGYMPPWSPDTTYSRFAHERLISTSEKNAILNWIASGSLAGDTTLAPAQPTYPQYQLYGTPDLEIQIPTFTSNATLDDSYVCFSIPIGLTQNRIVRAYEIVAGNPSIVHHVIVNIDTLATTSSDLSGSCYTPAGDFGLGGFAPGAPPTVFPSSGPLKMGITIKAGSKIVLQLHYPLGTAGQQDSTKIRLYFYPIGTTGVRPVYVTTQLQNWAFVIPANTVKTYTAKYPSGAATLTYSMSVLATFPHSHKIATFIENYAYAGVDTIPLIRINNWNFNWQGYYTFRNLVKVPNGYKLFSRHIYDNTSANPNNPSSPPINVVVGTSTNDEMLFDSFQWLLYQPGDELINIDSLLASDPLINGINESDAVISNNLRTYAYPNPFENTVRIVYTLEQPVKASIDVYSIYGNHVHTLQNMDETSGLHEIIWDGKNNSGVKLASGSYVYVIHAGNKQCYGKLTLISGK